MKQTVATKAKQIDRQWHLVDAKGQILGRVATRIAVLLMGKSKAYFVRHLDCGDYVVVVNAKDVAVTGKKLTQKIYTTYSGYPGGRKPEEVVRRGVCGMLPKNKLRDSMIKRLYIYSGEEHPHKDKFKM